MTKQERLEKEQKLLTEMRAHEDELHKQGIRYIAGIDEVGRGPLAGPVYAACMILPENFGVLGINDSKKVTEKRRTLLDQEIREKAIAYGIGIATAKEIDEVNILNATKKAMKRAIASAEAGLPEGEHIERLLIDAVKLDVDIPQESIIKGDAQILSIAAASIVAKVARDSYMIEMDEKYPGYAFASNKGYGTAAHYDGLMELGMTPIHRKTFIKENQVASKFYAVRVGRSTGIFTSWDECQKNINGYSGAVYKSFKTRAEAEEFLNGKTDGANGGTVATESQGGLEAAGAANKTEEASPVAVAYVDGSYDITTGHFACGGVILYQGNTHEFSKAFTDEDSAKLRNVAGEVMGSRTAIDYCLENGIDELIIYHDYEGIGKWGDDLWKANLDMTREYKAFVKEARTKMKITFVKVRAHSGDKYNEMADKLAKKALGI